MGHRTPPPTRGADSPPQWGEGATCRRCPHARLEGWEDKLGWAAAAPRTPPHPTGPPLEPGRVWGQQALPDTRRHP